MIEKKRPFTATVRCTKPKLRKQTALLLAGTLAVSFFLNAFAAAAAGAFPAAVLPGTIMEENAIVSGSEPLELYAASAVLMDGNSGRVLYDKNGDTPLPMASTTKIMTCILALEWMEEAAHSGNSENSGDSENAEENEPAEDVICTVSSNASAQPEVKLGLVTGDEFYLQDLLYSLMLESHNDTAVCIAETVGGSVEGFAEMMNTKAEEIGCTQTYYITPNGLDAEDENGEHHPTARDLALVMSYCLTGSPQKDAFLTVTRTASYTFTNLSGTRSYSCTNHNAFLNLMDGALSGKTGFTSKAGYCYVGSLQRDGKLLIVALLACGWPANKGYKWVDTKKLMNYGLSEFEPRDITDAEITTTDIPVTNGQLESVATTVEEPYEGSPHSEVLMSADDRVEIRVEQLQTLEAPVTAGEQVGFVHYLVDGTEYATASVVTAGEVKKRTYLYCLQKLTGAFLS
ncbi:MAG: D-alanyl-D-alanine carboxypeptidase [Lachnospiraceae bacterium]|nr:D-alanyl-D-alanine carboxypeptidase [Lachnospiraceae bacterium]